MIEPPFLPRVLEDIVEGAGGAGAGQTAQGKFAGQAYIAEQGHKDKVGHQKGAAAVLANAVGEKPDVAHAHRGAHGSQNKAGRGGELPGSPFVFHVRSSFFRHVDALQRQSSEVQYPLL